MIRQNMGGCHLSYDGPTSCRILDCGSWAVWGCQGSGAGALTFLAALAGAVFPWWCVSSCCPCQGPWCCWRSPRWWIVTPVNGIRCAWFQSFQNRILWDVWLQVHFFSLFGFGLVVFVFSYSSEKQFRKLYFTVTQDPSLIFPVNLTCTSVPSVPCLDPSSEKLMWLLYRLKH